MLTSLQSAWKVHCATRSIQTSHPDAKFSSTFDNAANGPSEQHHHSVIQSTSRSALNGELPRKKSLETRDASLIHKSQLTSVLAQSHRAYKYIRYGRKHNLGYIHPMALAMRQNPALRWESRTCQSWQTQSSSSQKPKARRFRLKISSVLAKYIRSVAALAPSNSHGYASGDPISASIHTSEPALDASSIAHAQMIGSAQDEHDLSRDTKSSMQEPTLEQELELLKRTASRQTEMVARESLTYLATQGYGRQDLAAWYWILRARTAEEAALRFGSLRKPPGHFADDFGPVPMFVFLRLLQRTDVSLRALTILIKQAWQVLASFDWRKVDTDPEIVLQSTSTKQPLEPIGLDALVVLVVRLLRHARQVWPASCVSIAQLWITHAKLGWIVRGVKQDTLSGKDSMRLSFCYNRILSLLSLPPNESPYQSLHHRQRAQFMVIRQMNTFNPPLTINREGYRGVVKVQLAHRKTHQERRWARLKAMSWPPWKEDKLGVDAFVGVEHGISRASDSLRQMAEAGNGTLDWEKSAGILAGWDTDNSPTIQTRSAMVPRSQPDSPHNALMGRSPVGFDSPTLDVDAIWVARIRATRTLQEAWICFLACKDQESFLTPQVYHAMFEKVIYDEMRNRRDLHSSTFLQTRVDDQLPLPGDGKEVVESSSSHNQAISTREPIPTSQKLLKQMTGDHIQPSGRFLEFLLSHARSYHEGVQVLQVSGLSDSMKKVLLPWRDTPIQDILSLLETLPDWLFAAYIGFLCKFAYVPRMHPSSFDTYHGSHGRVTNEIYETLFRSRHAFKLVIKRMPYYRPPWNSLLRLLARPESIVLLKKTSLDHYAQAIPKYHKACRVLDYMGSIGLGMDFTGFRSLCAIVKNAVASAGHILETSDDNEARSIARALLNDGLTLVKARFSQIVEPVDTFPGDYSLDLTDATKQSPSTPRLSRVPHPAHLHAYIRFLGQHPDCDGLAELVQWMSSYCDEIMHEAKETSNGLAMMRTCLVAVRAFLEQPLAEHNEREAPTAEDTKLYENGPGHVDGVRRIIGCKEEWGGWPTDEEVDQYSIEGDHRGSVTLDR